MQLKQRTLKKSVSISGCGLHSGKPATIEIFPAGADVGITFRRTDNPAGRDTPAHVSHVHATDLSTKIGVGPDSVSTIEHLMAAFAGLGIDNAIVHVNGPEIPILDGSSRPFVNAFNEAGFKSLQANRRFLIVHSAFEVRQGDRLMRVEPSSRLKFQCSIDFESRSRAIGKQSIEMTATSKSFLDLCAARTFCHVVDVETMRRMGLALGGSLDNAVVVNNDDVINEGGLRMHDEFVRHKLLDCIGDLALLGLPIIGKITTHKAGHALHYEFMKALLEAGSTYASIYHPTANRLPHAATGEAHWPATPLAASPA